MTSTPVLPDPPGLKECPDCGETKSRAEFRRNGHRPDGLSFYCRVCFSKRDKEAYRRRQAQKGRIVRERVSVPDGHKGCPHCEEVKPLSEWPRNRQSSDDYGSYCKTCHGVRSARDYLRRTYKLESKDVRVLIRQQAGMCPICLGARPEHVDHDHATGAIRGVLCFNCDAALGQFKDRPDVLRRAAAYVEGEVWRPIRIAPGVYQLPS